MTIYRRNYPIEKKLFERMLVDPLTNCFNWIAALDSCGYGRIFYKGQNRTAHTVSYELFNGEIKGKHVCHSCDNPKCINPGHLWLGTHKENQEDKAKKGRNPKKNPVTGRFMEKA